MYKVENAARDGITNLKFRCKYCGGVGPRKNTYISCQSHNTWNLKRHFNQVHDKGGVSAAFEKAYNSKGKRNVDDVEEDDKNDEPKLKQPKLSDMRFKSNCTQDQLNNAVTAFMVEANLPLTLGDFDSFQNMLKLMDPTKRGEFLFG